MDKATLVFPTQSSEKTKRHSIISPKFWGFKWGGPRCSKAAAEENKIRTLMFQQNFNICLFWSQPDIPLQPLRESNHKLKRPASAGTPKKYFDKKDSGEGDEPPTAKLPKGERGERKSKKDKDKKKKIRR